MYVCISDLTRHILKKLLSAVCVCIMNFECALSVWA